MTIVIGVIAVLTVAQLIVLGAMGGIGPLKFIHDNKIANDPGNAEEYHLENVTPLENSPLAGKKLLFLGSSVTYGSASLGVSMADYIAELEDFDRNTVIGAMEYIIAYVKQTWDCPVIFYTGTKYGSEPYAAMVDALLRLQDKWDIGVIDLWNDPDMNAVSGDDYDFYMNDSIHPTQAGYLKWWTPKFEAYLAEIFATE